MLDPGAMGARSEIDEPGAPPQVARRMHWFTQSADGSLVCTVQALKSSVARPGAGTLAGRHREIEMRAPAAMRAMFGELR